PPQPAEVTDPRWTRRPRDLSRFYPARARERGVEGEVLLDCAVSAQGALDCAVARETLAGWGFGEAAQRIAAEHRMVPATREGQPVAARYRMRLPFELN
ncbi:MAG TPA: TonB family protein, partial [Terricaulis sp.]|nr:TonB family protein [Terricaulis sp.]